MPRSGYLVRSNLSGTTGCDIPLRRRETSLLAESNSLFQEAGYRQSKAPFYRYSDISNLAVKSLRNCRGSPVFAAACSCAGDVSFTDDVGDMTG